MTSQHENKTPQPGDDAFEGYRKDLDDAERKVAGEIDPGARAMVVAVAVLVLVGTLALPMRELRTAGMCSRTTRTRKVNGLHCSHACSCGSLSSSASDSRCSHS